MRARFAPAGAARNRGFTLIELLVVIAILALLVSILMPSLRQARKLARRVICATQLKQWGTAVGLYATENDGQLLASARVPWIDYVRTQIIWKRSSAPDEFADELNMEAMNEYIATPFDVDNDTIRPESIAFCPSTDRQFQAEWGARRMTGWWGGYEGARMTYGYYAHVSDWPRGLVNGAEEDLADKRIYAGQRVLMSDVLRWHPFTGTFDSNHPWSPASWGAGGRLLGDHRRIEGINRLFTDGHAAWLPAAEMDTASMVNGAKAPAPSFPYIVIDPWGGVQFYR